MNIKMLNIKKLQEPQIEDDIQAEIINLLNTFYPDIPVKGNHLSGVELHSSKGKRPYKTINKIKRLSGDRYFPDIEILSPRFGYHGMFIELKTLHTKAFLKDGNFSNSKEGLRARAQYEYGKKLKNQGYWFEFGIGLRDSMIKIVDYLEGE